MSLKLLTLVWERAPLKDGALVLLLALADWADDNGVAFPSVGGLAFKARMGERHARRLLREFEAEGLIATEQRGVHHRPNSYRISLVKLRSFPERLNGPPSEESEGVPVSEDRTPTSEVRTPVAPDPSIEPSINQKVDDHPTEQTELSASADRFVDWFVSLLARTNAPEPKLTPTIRAGWSDAYEKLRRIDGKEKVEIAKVCEWARADPFWSTNFYSPAKLRERKDGISRYDLFLSKLKSPHASSTNQRSNSRALGDNSNISALEEYERELVARNKLL